MASLSREKNGNWKGGRHRAQSGYIRIMVGIGHHLADIYGYAYEHRVVAESVLGRPLTRHDIIHHKNGDRADNTPDNLMITRSIAEHAAHHRKRADLRLPGEGNPIVICECGCGRPMPLYSQRGAPRRFLRHHQMGYKPLPFCACGCGRQCKWRKSKYLRGHAPTKCSLSPLVQCACGCGALRKAIGIDGRPRQFIHGHNNRSAR